MNVFRLCRPRSLRWQLVQRIAFAQSLMLLVLIGLSLAALGAVMLWSKGPEGVYEFNTIDALTDAARRDREGKLVLAETPQLRRLRAEVPDLWFVIHDRQGAILREGQPPDYIQAILPSLDFATDARLAPMDEENGRTVAVLRSVDTAAGKLRILGGAQGRMTLSKVLRGSTPVYQLSIFVSGLMTLAVIAVTPFVVRRALKGLDQVAHTVQEIDIDSGGLHLECDAVPLEVLPFVNAVNDAFDRLDKGFECRKRFLADAAHELRTPIAILTTRLSALPPGALRSRLMEDAARLSALANQLLDLQRLEQQQVTFHSVELVALAERVVLDIAPLAFAAGYEMHFEPPAGPVQVQGDQMAIERALTNLIQNAISYGGRQGGITIRVDAARWIEVQDEGSGVPEAEREHIFAPFHRLKQDGAGVGLGLDLVTKLMQLHGGQVSLSSAAGRGACFRLSFPGIFPVPHPPDCS